VRAVSAAKWKRAAERLAEVLHGSGVLPPGADPYEQKPARDKWLEWALKEDDDGNE